MELTILVGPANFGRTQNVYPWQKISDDAFTLVVFPSADKFNDFGTQALTQILVFANGGVTHLTGKMILAPRSTRNVERSVSSLLTSSLSTTSELPRLSSALLEYLYLTVLTDRDQYQKLVDVLGAKYAQQALLELHDVGALQAFDQSNDHLLVLREKSEFGQVLLRLDATFVAMLDVENILTAENIRREGSGLEVLSASLPFLERGALNFRFEKTALGTNRINILIGENGVGKSQILRGIASGASSQEGKRLHTILFIPSPLDQKEAFVAAQGVLIKEHPALHAGWTAVTSGLARLARDPENKSWAILERVLAPFLPIRNLAVPLRPAESNADMIDFWHDQIPYAYIATRSSNFEGVKTRFFGNVDFTRPPVFSIDDVARVLSSGERALVGLAVTLLRDVPINGVVLLDEPELSLHPRMIAELMRLLGLVLEAQDAWCLIATHSLYVVREASSEGVHVLKRSEENASIVQDYEPMLQTLGAGLTELSNVIFDDWSIEELYEKRLKEFAALPRSESEIRSVQRHLGESGIAALHDAVTKRVEST